MLLCSGIFLSFFLPPSLFARSPFKQCWAFPFFFHLAFSCSHTHSTKDAFGVSYGFHTSSCYTHLQIIRNSQAGAGTYSLVSDASLYDRLFF